MADVPTPGEIGRSVDRIEGTLHGLDSKVDKLDDKIDGWREEVIDLRNKSEANTKALAELRADTRSAAERQENRRWLVYLALVAAALSFLAQLYFSAKGQQ